MSINFTNSISVAIRMTYYTKEHSVRYINFTLKRLDSSSCDLEILLLRFEYEFVFSVQEAELEKI